MKLKEGFITHTLQGQQMMVAAGPAARLFRGVVRSNETAAFIIDCLKTKRSRRWNRCGQRVDKHNDDEIFENRAEWRLNG